MRAAGQRLTSLVSVSVSRACGFTALSLQVYADCRTMPSGSIKTKEVSHLGEAGFYLHPRRQPHDRS